MYILLKPSFRRQPSVTGFLIGSKFYKADNTSAQGPGSAGSDPNFEFQTADFPNYQNQSAYDYPNLNVAIFGENIFYVNDKLSITPGIRFEHIKTESDGFFKRINTDGAGNVILNVRVTKIFFCSIPLVQYSTTNSFNNN